MEVPTHRPLQSTLLALGIGIAPLLAPAGALAAAPQVQVMASTQRASAWLTIDQTHVYWAQRASFDDDCMIRFGVPVCIETSKMDAQIRRIPKQGGAVEVVVDKQPQIDGIGFVAGELYYARGADVTGYQAMPISYLVHRQHDGKLIEYSFAPPDADGNSFTTADVSFLRAFGGVLEAALNGSPIAIQVPLGSANFVPETPPDPRFASVREFSAAAIDDQHLYFSSSAECRKKPCKVQDQLVRRPLTGGMEEKLAGPYKSITSVVVDHGEVYYAADGALYALARAGGKPSVLTKGNVTEVAVDATSVYFIAGDAIKRVTRPAALDPQLKVSG